MRKILTALLFAVSASWASAGDLPLDWSSPDALKASSASLSPDDAKLVTRAGAIVAIRKLTTETKFVPGLMQLGGRPQAELFAVMKSELEGKSMEEIQAIAASMN